MVIPVPRKPRCIKHHTHLASCADCMAELRGRRTVTRCPDHPVHTEGCDTCAVVRVEEQAAAQKRLDRAAR